MSKKRKVGIIEGEGAGAGTLDGLPLDLQIRILILLPVKTLLLLRSVCRWFLSVIDSHRFMSSHLRHIKQHPRKLLSRNKLRGWTCVSSSVDGLVLLVHSSSPGLIKPAMLYNPSTRRKRVLEREFNFFALGYKRPVSATSPHKIKRYHVLGLSCHQALIYSLQLDKWIEDITKTSGFRPQEKVLYSQKFCLGGPVIWCESSESNNTFRVVGFSFKSKKFCHSDDMSFAVRFGIFKIRSSDSFDIGVWKIGADQGGVASVYSLQRDTMMLIPLYTIPSEVLPFRMDHVGIDVLKVSVHNEKWVTVYWRRGSRRANRYSVTYDLKTHAIQTRLLETWQGYRSGDLWIGYYIESLVMV